MYCTSEKESQKLEQSYKKRDKKGKGRPEFPDEDFGFDGKDLAAAAFNPAAKPAKSALKKSSMSALESPERQSSPLAADDGRPRLKKKGVSFDNLPLVDSLERKASFKDSPPPKKGKSSHRCVNHGT